MSHRQRYQRSQHKKGNELTYHSCWHTDSWFQEELVNRLDRKLEVLRSEQLVVTEECKINDELGENVEAHIRRLARPHEADKFRLHIEEVGKITSLLLGLSGRLARAENALMGMPEDHPERVRFDNVLVDVC